jgi:class 3 adenylate cyclase
VERPHHAALRSNRLIGRREESEWLHHSVELASRGEPRVVTIVGEAGIGKSRLLKEVRSHAADHGLALGLGRAHEDMPIPYRPMIELFDSLVRDCEQRGVSVDGSRSPLAPFDRNAAPEAPATSTSARVRFFAEISERVISLASLCPIALAVDDLHWLDEASLTLLSSLAFSISDARQPVAITLLMTTRSVEPGITVSRLLERLARESFSDVIELSGLDERETGELIRAAGIVHPSSQLVKAVLETTAGNPLFIEALVGEMGASGAVDRVSGDTVLRLDPAEFRLSQDMTTATAARLESVPHSDLALLEYGALVGQRFDPALACRVAGVPDSQLRDLMHRNLGVIHPSGESLEFDHPLLRHLLCQRIPRELRQRMHLEIAEDLEKAGRAEGAALWEIVRHLMAAGHLAASSWVFEYGHKAGDWAAGLCAWTEAGEAYAVAADNAPDLEQRAPLHLQAARCFMKNYDRGLRREHYQRAKDSYFALRDAEGGAEVVAESARSDLYEEPVGTLRNLTPLEDALCALPEDSFRLRGLLRARVADAYFYARQPARGIEHASEALALGEKAGDHELCSDACISQGLALHQAMEFDRSEERYRAAVHHVRLSGSRWLEGGTRVRRGAVLFSLGRLDECREELESGLAVARELNDTGEEAFALAHLAGLDASRGDFEQAEERAHGALRLNAQVEWRPWVPMLAIPALAWSRAVVGDWRRADDALAALGEPGRLLERVGGAVRGMVQIERALVRAASADATGLPGFDPTEVVERYASRIVLARADGSGLGVVAALIELADSQAMCSSVQGAVEVLSRARDAGALLCSGWPCLISRVLGVAAMARGAKGEGLGLFDDAIAQGERIGTAPELGRTCLDYARALVTTRGYEQERQARDLLSRASEIFERLGMRLYHRQAANLARVLGMETTHDGGTTAGLRARDTDLLCRLAKGHDDHRIARDLLIEPSTVRSQISDLVSHLGVEGRREAVAYALDHQLVPALESDPQVTLLVTDLKDFTRMVERLGDVAARAVIQLHNRILRSTLRDHSGREITHTGDGVIASFRSAAEAIGCSLALQERFEEHGQRGGEEVLRVRIGLHAGHPLPEDGRLFGSAVNTAVRICAACPAGEIRASESVRHTTTSTVQCFEPAGRVHLKGLPDELELFRVTVPPST